MGESESKPRSLLASFRRIADSLLGILQARLRLFSLELQSERLRLVDLLLKLAVALAFATVGLLLGTFTLALFVWQVARYAGLVAMTVLLLAAGGFLVWRIRRELQQAPPPFAKTIAEFKKDRECLPKND